MLLGALVDCGVPLEVIRNAIAALGLDRLQVNVEHLDKLGIAATKVHVVAPHEHVHRHLPDIVEIITRSSLGAEVKRSACDAFRALAVAEARVHDIPVDHVHFHEVGALDAIADVVGVVAGFAHLDLAELSCRGIPVSHGTVRCAHGVLPVPAPAVVHLMEGLPTYPLDIDGETVTPTAAALLKVLVTRWQAPGAMTIERNGYGAGSKDFPRANVLRLIVGQRAHDASVEVNQSLSLLATNLDDMNPEWLPPLMERLLAAGARDVWLTPILMKKGRPAHTLSVLCDPTSSRVLRELIYRHTSTLGIRETVVDRYSLPRESRSVATPWGEIAVKVATLPDGSARAAPEHDDCRRASDAHGVSLATVHEAAIAAWRASED